MPEGSLPQTNAGCWPLNWGKQTPILLEEGSNHSLSGQGRRKQDMLWPVANTKREHRSRVRVGPEARSPVSGARGWPNWRASVSIPGALARKPNILCQTLRRSGSRWESQRMCP